MLRSKARQLKIDDDLIEPLVVYLLQLVEIADGRKSGDIANELRKAMSQFRVSLPLLTYGLFEASGIATISEDDLERKSTEAVRLIERVLNDGSNKIDVAVVHACERVEGTAKEATAELEAVKIKANEITVKGAQDQFAAAAASLKVKSRVCFAITVVFFVALMSVLLWFTFSPPKLIASIVNALTPGSRPVTPPVSVPLLIAASAYFTSIRLALIGALGVGLAFSLRMTRAYLHMIEHNHHKSRVTNSIEGFVASVRTPEQKDLVLGKLVDSVTQFGDSGILDKDGDKASGLSSVILETGRTNPHRWR